MRSSIMVAICDFLLISFIAMVPNTPPPYGQSIVSLEPSVKAPMIRSLLEDASEEAQKWDPLTASPEINDALVNAMIQANDAFQEKTSAIIELNRVKQEREQLHNTLKVTENRLDNTQTELLKAEDNLKQKNWNILRLESQFSDTKEAQLLLAKTETKLEAKEEQTIILEKKLAEFESLKIELARKETMLEAVNEKISTMGSTLEDANKIREALIIANTKLEQVRQQVEDKDKELKEANEAKLTLVHTQVDLETSRELVTTLRKEIEKHRLAKKQHNVYTFRKEVLREIRVEIKEKDLAKDDTLEIQSYLPIVMDDNGSMWLFTHVANLGFTWKEFKDGEVVVYELIIRKSGDNPRSEKYTNNIRVFGENKKLAAIELAEDIDIKTCRFISIDEVRKKLPKLIAFKSKTKDKSRALNNHYAIATDGNWIEIEVILFQKEVMGFSLEPGDYLMTQEGEFVGVMMNDKICHLFDETDYSESDTISIAKEYGDLPYRTLVNQVNERY